MPITPNMTITTPSVSVTAGPEWASILNAAFSTVDVHDHSDGKGVKVTPLGLNINSDLSIGSNNLNLVKSLRLVSLGAALSGASDLRAIYSVNGDLYYNNGGGAQIQLTSGGSVTAASDGTSRRFETQAIAANTTINPASTYSFVEVDTTTSVTLTLPAANAVSTGRFYEIKDVSGLAATNNITIQRAGADTINGSASSIVFNYNQASGRFVSDGVSNWQFSSYKPTPLIQTNQIADSQVTTAKIADGAVTQAKRAALNYALSASSGTFSTSSTTFVDVTNLTVSITTTGRPVIISVVGDDGASSRQLSIPSGGAVISLNKNSAEFSNMTLGPYAPASSNMQQSFTYFDPADAGLNTYKIQVRTLSGGSVLFHRAKLVAYEL